MRPSESVEPLVAHDGTAIPGFPTHLQSILTMNGKYHIILDSHELLLVALPRPSAQRYPFGARAAQGWHGRRETPTVAQGVRDVLLLTEEMMF